MILGNVSKSGGKIKVEGCVGLVIKKNEDKKK